MDMSTQAFDGALDLHSEEEKIDMAFSSSTSGYDLGVFAFTAASSVALFMNFMVGGLMTAGAALLALQTKERKDEEVKLEATRVSQAAILETAARIGTEFDKALQGYGDEVSEALASRLKRKKEQLEQVGKHVSNEVAGKDREQSLRTLNGKLKNLTSEFDDLREKLWLEVSAKEASVTLEKAE